MKRKIFSSIYFFFFFAVTAFSALFLSKPSVFASDIVINEFQIEPTGASQWVELYNKGNEIIDLSNWIIDDSSGSTSYKITEGTIIGSGKCISFQSGKFYFNPASSDSARLIDNNGQEIDVYSYSESPGINISFGRMTDGSDNWTSFNNSTRDRFNSDGNNCLAPTPTPSPIVINTPTLTPTNFSTPTKALTPKIILTPKLTATLKSAVVTKFSLISTNKSLTPSKVLTKTVQKEVLGEKNKEITFLTKTPTASETPKVETKVLGASENNILSKILIGIGAIFILSCGILAIRAYKNKHEE